MADSDINEGPVLNPEKQQIELESESNLSEGITQKGSKVKKLREWYIIFIILIIVGGIKINSAISFALKKDKDEFGYWLWDFIKDIYLIWGIILSLFVFAGAMISLGVIWLKSGVNKKTKKLDKDDGRKKIVGLKEDFVAGRKKVSVPSFGLVLAIKVLAIYFILIGSYRLSWYIYFLVVSRPKYEFDINTSFVLMYFLAVILHVWPCILGIGSFRMFRWSRVCIIWLLYIELFSAIWEKSVIIYWYLGGWTAGHPFYLAPIIYSILIPLLFIGFYSHKKVKAAFESKDRCIRWNDKHPYLLWLINIVVGLILFILTVPNDIRSILSRHLLPKY